MATKRLSGHIVIWWTFLTIMAFLFGGNALCRGAHQGARAAAPGGPCDSFGDIASHGLPIAIPMLLVALCLFAWWLVGSRRMVGPAQVQAAKQRLREPPFVDIMDDSERERIVVEVARAFGYTTEGTNSMKD